MSPIEGGHAVTVGGVSFGNLHHFTLDGQGATFLFSGLQQAMTWVNCSDITLRNIVIDWQRPPFSQGWVTAVAPDLLSFDVQVNAKYPVTGTEPVLAFQAYDPQARSPLPSSVVMQNTVTGVSLTAPQHLHIVLSKPCTLVAGNLVVLRHAIYNYDGCFLGQCSNVLVQNVSVYTCPGMGLMANHCENVSLQGFNVCRAPGSNRLMTSTADATHFIGCKGSLEVVGCLLENQGDDALNVHGKYYTVANQTDSASLDAVIADSTAVPRDGDTLELSDGTTLATTATATVASTTYDEQSGACHITLTSPITAPVHTGVDFLLDTTWLPKVHIMNCTARNNRGRGFVIRARDALVEENSCSHIAGPGVEISCSAFWMEGPASQNVIVRGNTFSECNNSVYLPVGGFVTGSITVRAELADHTDSPVIVHQGITLANNTIKDSDHTGIYIGSASGCHTHSNPMANCNRKSQGFIVQGTIGIRASTDVNIHDNSYDAASGTLGTIVPYPGTDPSTIWASNNPGFTTPSGS